MIDRPIDRPLARRPPLVRAQPKDQLVDSEPVLGLWFGCGCVGVNRHRGCGLCVCWLGHRSMGWAEMAHARNRCAKTPAAEASHHHPTTNKGSGVAHSNETRKWPPLFSRATALLLAFEQRQADSSTVPRPIRLLHSQAKPSHHRLRLTASIDRPTPLPSTRSATHPGLIGRPARPHHSERPLTFEHSSR